jgi:hypothetical protein
MVISLACPEYENYADYVYERIKNEKIGAKVISYMG